MRRLLWAGIFVLVLWVFHESVPWFFSKLDHQIFHLRYKLSKYCIEKNILAYWSFDESLVKDIISQHIDPHQGTLLVRGRFGKARWFYGRPHNTINTDFDFKRLTSSYTFSFWVKFTKRKDAQTIVCNQRGDIPYIWLENGKFNFRVLNPGHHQQVLSWSWPNKKYGKWVHMACVVDVQKHEACIYKDGVLKQKVSIGEIYERPEPMLLGQHNNGFWLNFVLDEMVIRNYAMSSQEILAESSAKMSLPYRLYSSLMLKLKFYERLRQGIARLEKGVDLLNLFNDQSTLFKSALPQFHFYLSSSDRKAFNRDDYFVRQHGIMPDVVSRPKQIYMDLDGEFCAAFMELEGQASRACPYGKKTFTIQLEGQKQFQGKQRFIFVPPEADSFLRPLLKNYFMNKYRQWNSKLALGMVWINEEFQGLYYFQEAGLFQYESRYDEKWNLEHWVKILPVSKKDLLAVYDKLTHQYLSLWTRDRSSFLSCQEIEYYTARDRQTIESLPVEDFESNDEVLLKKVKDYLTETYVLGNNPDKECVLYPLDFSNQDVQGVAIWWSSDQPDIINNQGEVKRPQGDMSVQVIVTAHLTRGSVHDEKKMYFTVMPLYLKRSILEVLLPEFIRTHNVEMTIHAHEYIHCSVRLIEEGSENKSSLVSARIKLHGNTALFYPKKSFKINTDYPHNFLDFSPKTDLVLASSFNDLSFMRNQMAYDLFRSFSTPDHPEYAPKHHLIDLFINHAYQGIYEFTEDVQASILGLESYSKQDAIHAVLYKAEGEQANFAGLAQWAYTQKEPNVKHGEYWKPYQDLIQFLGAAPSSVFQKEAEKRLDLLNMIDWQIFLNLVNQMDGPDHNLYLARNNKPDSKFFIVPWDYDKSMGGPVDRINMDHLFKRLMCELPDYNKQLKARWQTLRKDLLTEQALMQRMDDIEKKISDRLDQNFAMFPPPRQQRYDDFVKDMREWFKQRLVFLDQYFASVDMGQQK